MPCNEGLVGLIFVVRRSSTPPEIIFQHPPPELTSESLLDLGKVDSLTPRISFRRTVGLFEKRPMNVRRGGGSTGLPQITHNYPKIVSPRQRLEYVGSPTRFSSVTKVNEKFRESKRFEIGSDARMKWRCFGVSSHHLANLLLPPDSLCNQGFQLEIDSSGHKNVKEKPKYFGQQEHLKFICFPRHIGKKDNTVTTSTYVEKVVKFAVVFVFDSNYTIDTESVFHVEANFSLGLLETENKFGYLSREVNQICSYIHTLRTEQMPSSGISSAFESPTMESATDLVDSIPKLVDRIHDRSKLAKMLRQLYLQLREKGYAHFRFHGCIGCHLTSYPMHKVKQPKWYQAAILLESKEVIRKRLPVDGLNEISKLINSISPNKSVLDITMELCLSLATTQNILEHLVFWQVARIVDKLTSYQVYVLNVKRDGNHLIESGVSREFNGEFKTTDSVFAQILGLFGNGSTIAEAKTDFLNLQATLLFQSTTFFDVFCWLMAKNLILLKRAYYLFNPFEIYEQSDGIPFVPRIMVELKFVGVLPSSCGSRISVSSLTGDALVKVLRNCFKEYYSKENDFLSSFSPDDLITLYLFVQEQFRISETLSVKNTSRDFSSEDALAAIPWKNTTELEAAMKVDISRIQQEEGGLSQRTQGAMLFLLDLVSVFIRKGELDVNSIKSELNGSSVSCSSSSLRLFEQLIEKRQFGVFSHCFLEYSSTHQVEFSS